MNESELLEKYEPVLRFAKSERFFPMAVDRYVEKSSIFASGPQGVLELLSHLHEPLIKRMGKFESEQFYLRFVNKPLYDSDIWVWWAALSVVGILSGWFIGRVAGIEVATSLSLLAALIIFMLASPIRLRIIPAVIAASFFLALEVAPIWFFLRPSQYISIAVEYLVLLPIYLIALFYLSVRTMKFVLERVVPEGPGLVMDILSQATEKIAQEAFRQYTQILEDDPRPVYYGRVLHETDSQSNHWTVLQYHFFYAFNDWRLAANGMNHHEGDWEMVAVYLKNGNPYSVLFSQHGAGNFERWESVCLSLDEQGQPTTHPVVYVALGSHANYRKPEVIRSPSMYKPGRLQRMLFWVDGLVHYLFLLLNPSQKARRLALKDFSAMRGNLLTQDGFDELRDETDHFIVSLPMELATGDGFRIGYPGDDPCGESVDSADYLKRIMSERVTTHPRESRWSQILLNSEVDWLQYKGLWGVKSFLKEESGPPGPQWDRPEKGAAAVKERIRWSKPLDWLAELDKRSH